MAGPTRATPGWHRRAAAMAAIVLVVGGLVLALGDRIGVNAGQGWDGQNYTAWAIDFPGAVIDRGVTRYHAQRVLPSAVLHAALRATGVDRTVAHAITAFALFDLALLALCAALWAHLAAVMAWRPAAAWAGFAALFLSFANARHALYYPTLTDTAAFALGLAMVWGYLTRRGVVVWITAALGAFTWPALPLVGFAMLVLPRPPEPVAAPDERVARFVPFVAATIAIAGVATVLGIVYFWYRHPMAGVGDEKLVGWIRADLLAITIPVFAVMLAAGWYALARLAPLWNLKAFARGLSPIRTAIAIAGCAAIVGARMWWVARVGRQANGPNTDQFLCEYSLETLRGPLWGPVHHVVYFGPIIAVAGLAWRRIAALAAAWGPAIVVALALVVAFAVASESRQWIHLFPLVVVVSIAATEDRWTPRRAAVFTAIAAAWSMLWLPLRYEVPGPHHAWPAQRYFMHLGPYASDETYAYHLVAVALTGVAVWLLLRRPAPASAPAAT